MTGGTLRGNLSVGDSAFLKTDGTIIGTSFQASESIHLDGVTRNVAVIDNNGYFHSRTSTEFISDLNLQKEAFLQWGGQNIASGFSPIDASMIPALGANRLAFGNASAIKVEYSRDGGTTWVDYGATVQEKTNVFSCLKQGGLRIGKTSSGAETNANYLLRITIDTDAYPIYTKLNKFMIYCSTNGSVGSYVTIDASLKSTPTVWKTFMNKANISGWSGYNIINIPDLVTYGNTPGTQYGLVRFTFGISGHNSTNYSGLTIINIFGYGGVGWSCPSTLASTGELFTYDYTQKASFPAGALFKGNITI